MTRVSREVEFPLELWSSFQGKAPVRRLLEKVPALREISSWPSPDEFQELAIKLSSFQKLGLGFKLEEKPGQRKRRKIPKDTLRSYEAWIFEDAAIPTRAQNLHDFFNALIWMNFPSGKLALHRKSLEVREAWRASSEFVPGRRSALSDRLTCFDEGGVVLELAPEEDRNAVEEILRGRDDLAKEKYVREHRGQFTIFGHGILEVAMKSEAVSLHASCLILDRGDVCLDDKVSQYFTSFSDATLDNGTIDAIWLLSK